MVDQRLEILTDGPELLRADVQRLPGGGPLARREQDRLDEILDREQLVPVGAVAQRVDPAPVADPVEEDLEDPEPLGPDERLRAQDHAVQAAPHEGADGVFGLDLRLAVVADAVERVVLLDRMLVRHAVDGVDVDETNTTRTPASAAAESRVSVPSTLTDSISARDPRIGSAAAACTRIRAPWTSSRAAVSSRMSPELANLSFELRVVEADEVERPHLVPVGEEPTSQVQAEKSRSAADGPDHRARLTAGDTSQ